MKTDVIQKIYPSMDNCLEDCTVRTYTIKERQAFTSVNQSNMSKAFFFWHSTNYVEEQEYVIYDIGTIVGTVGGSLGLFLGLSCRGVLDQAIESLWIIYMKYAQKA